MLVCNYGEKSTAWGKICGGGDRVEGQRDTRKDINYSKVIERKRVCLSLTRLGRKLTLM